MKIGLHDAEKAHFKNKSFPNLAIMKISAWHKSRGDTVEWWNPLYQYDRVYSSKVFDFTPIDPYIPEDAIRGGTGYCDTCSWDKAEIGGVCMCQLVKKEQLLEDKDEQIN